LSEGYNNKPHSALDGKTPVEVFGTDNAPLRFSSIEALGEAFLHEEERMVDKTGCLNLSGKVYDAGSEWRRKKVTVRFDPFNLEEIQLWHGGELKKIIRTAHIGEYNATQKVECEQVEEKATSRVLNAFLEDQQKRFKKTSGAFRLSEGEKNGE